MATAKITVKSKLILEHIQKEIGGTQGYIIETALRELDKHIAFKKFNDAYLKLKNNPEAWAEELKEREAMEGTLEDGLED